MADLLLEIRCEELPAHDVRGAARNMETALRDALAAAGLPAAGTTAMWTPRRIALHAAGLADRTPDREERIKGPRASAAFDGSGAPTRAADGFARKNGVEPSALVRDGDFVWAVVRTPGRPARDVVAAVVPALPAKAGWRKTMRWGPAQTFARPIRGLVAILGADVIPCEIAGVAAGRATRGHRFLAPAEIVLGDASLAGYVEALRAAKVLVRPDERLGAVLGAARGVSAGIRPREELLEEVVNLVEWPSALLGNFDARYLELPPRLLVTVMEHHQRFFPVRQASGALAPHFVAILDREPSSVEPSRRGFERVLVPRLHDATFFFSEDRKKPLSDRLARLETVVFHRKLGTLREKAERLSSLCASLAPYLGADPVRAARAGLLAKCDLVTLLVGEFPELQGHVGSVYAALDGEDAAVAGAIDWQYRHDFGDAERPSPEALCLLLAENLDNLRSFAAADLLPTGTTDPFGLRRSAIAVLDACERWAPGFDVVEAVRLPRRVEVKVGAAAAPVATTQVGEFPALETYLDTRLRQRFRDRGVPPDHLDAVASWRSVGEFARAVADLGALAAHPEFDRLLEVAERCRNITRKSDAPHAAVRPELLSEPAERGLWAAWTSVRSALPDAPAPLLRAEAERIAAVVAGPLHRFFDEVFVNADDAAVRANRHAILREIDAALLRFADLCRVVRKRA